MAYNFHQELVLVATATASASTSVTITSGIDSKFVNYLLKCRNCSVNAASGMITLQMSTNFGLTWLTTNKSSTLENGTTNDNNNNTSTIYMLGDVPNSTTTVGNMDVTLYNLTNSQVKMVYGFGGYYQTFNNIVACHGTAAVQTGTTAVNALKLATSNTNFTGNFYLYGIVEP